MIRENLPIKGIFRCRVIHRSGRTIEEYEDRNLVVNTGRNGVANLLAGSSTTKNITQIAFGTSGTAPSPTDSDLVSKFSKAIDGYTFPSTGSVRFAFTLAFAEANGKDIREFGLFNADGQLFSRKTRDAIEKTSDIQIVGEWTIQF